LDALTPGGAADQSDPAPDLQLIPEATLQATTATNTGSITDDRFGLNLSRLAEGDLIAETGRVPDDRPIVQLAAHPHRGVLIHDHLLADAGTGLDLHVTADPRLSADGDLLAEDRPVADHCARLHDRVLPEHGPFPHGDGLDEPSPVADRCVGTDRGSVTDLHALTDGDVRPDGDIGPDSAVLTDHRALGAPGARFDLDIPPVPRTSAALSQRDRHIDIGSSNCPDLSPVAGLPGIALAHPPGRAGACPGLRRRHDRLPLSSSRSAARRVGEGCRAGLASGACRSGAA